MSTTILKDIRCSWTGSSDGTLPTVTSVPIACPAAVAKEKRNIIQPNDAPDGFSDFWSNELNNARVNGNMLPLKGTPVQEGDLRGGVSSSALMIFGNQPFRYGADRQRGCTSIWILTRKGLWAAHIWEVGSMGMIDLDEHGETVEQDIEFFQPAVLDFINNGNPSE